MLAERKSSSYPYLTVILPFEALPFHSLIVIKLTPYILLLRLYLFNSNSCLTATLIYSLGQLCFFFLSLTLPSSLLLFS